MIEEVTTIEVAHEEIANATMRWLREHGYFVAWDTNKGCYRIILEGIDRKDDTPYPAEFRTRKAAYYRALQLVMGKK